MKTEDHPTTALHRWTSFSAS
jgi:putative Mn2+ efflux pump MntP